MLRKFDTGTPGIRLSGRLPLSCLGQLSQAFPLAAPCSLPAWSPALLSPSLSFAHPSIWRPESQTRQHSLPITDCAVVCLNL